MIINYDILDIPSDIFPSEEELFPSTIISSAEKKV